MDWQRIRQCVCVYVYLCVCLPAMTANGENIDTQAARKQAEAE